MPSSYPMNILWASFNLIQTVGPFTYHSVSIPDVESPRERVMLSSEDKKKCISQYKLKVKLSVY